jgi:hypothetical protein
VEKRLPDDLYVRASAVGSLDPMVRIYEGCGLHRKETFLAPEDERVAEFARLTAQEEKHGLLDDASAIGTRDGRSRRSAERGFRLKGHRLIRVS